MHDLIIGAIANYNFDQIKFWVNSLDRSGFTGDKFLLCYNIDNSVIDELKSRNYITRSIDRDGKDVLVERFYHYWIVLNNLKVNDYRYVIATDISDVIFQRNPSEWLEKHLSNHKINASGESIKYHDEIWGRNNMTNSFGELLFEHNKDKVISNAGVMSGDFNTMKDLFLNIFLCCGGAPSQIEGGGGPDQAAYNILLNTTTYNNITKFTNSEEAWAAQLGTTGDPNKIGYYRQFLVDPEPIMRDNKICTSTGEPFYIVHQYNRTVWKNKLEEIYGV
jgi:hypothetical protein